MPDDTAERRAVRQIPTAYRYAVGDIIVTAANDGQRVNAVQEGFVRNAGLSEVVAALDAAGLPDGKLPITFTPIVIETGSRRILVDTGFGDSGPSTAGLLRSNLAAAGITPDSIDMVFITHGHGDHINGLIDAEGRPIYPAAEVVLPEAEWAFWTDKTEAARATGVVANNFANMARVFAPLKDRLRTVPWGTAVAPGVTTVDARGHTPGHTALMLESEGEKLLFIADVTNHPALFARHPHWAVAFDMDPEQAVATRRRLLGMIADEGLRMAGYHYPYPATGRMIRDGEGFRFLPAQFAMVS